MISITKDPILLAAAIGTWLPFFSMAVILLFTRHNGKLSSRISVGAIATSFLCAFFLFVKLHGLGAPVQYQTAWLMADNIFVPVGYLLDSLSLTMLIDRRDDQFPGPDLLTGIHVRRSRVCTLLCVPVALRLGHDEHGHRSGDAATLHLLGTRRARVLPPDRVLL